MSAIEDNKNKEDSTNSTWSTVKKFLGFEEFRKLEEIKEYLQAADSTQDFTKAGHYLLYDNSREFRLWIITSKTHAFVVRDDKTEIKVLLKRPKTEFKSQLIYENRNPRLYISNTITSLPISGSSNTVETVINQLIKE